MRQSQLCVVFSRQHICCCRIQCFTHTSHLACGLCIQAPVLIPHVHMQVALLGLFQHLPDCWRVFQSADTLHQQPQMAIFFSGSAAGHCTVGSVVSPCAHGVCCSCWWLCLGQGLLDGSMVCCCCFSTLGCGADHGDHIQACHVACSALVNSCHGMSPCIVGCAAGTFGCVSGLCLQHVPRCCTFHNCVKMP